VPKANRDSAVNKVNDALAKIREHFPVAFTHNARFAVYGTFAFAIVALLL
jgi:hypothetical protein